jgi:hypothetical protein
MNRSATDSTGNSSFWGHPSGRWRNRRSAPAGPCTPRICSPISTCRRSPRRPCPWHTAQLTRAKGYPWGLLAAAEGFPLSTAWCYTGAVENHPDLIDAIARVHPLAGNPGDVVRRLRDPVHLAAAARAAGLSFPKTISSPDRIPLDGTWLVKPLASAGGRGIRRWTPAVAADHTADRANELRPRSTSGNASCPASPCRRLSVSHRDTRGCWA